MTNIIVAISAGYVGLVATCCLTNSGRQVTCVETDQGKLKPLKQGLSPIK